MYMSTLNTQQKLSTGCPTSYFTCLALNSDFWTKKRKRQKIESFKKLKKANTKIWDAENAGFLPNYEVYCLDQVGGNALGDNFKYHNFAVTSKD